MSILETAKNVFSVGVKDKNRRMFDALIPLPDGTSYNSYLVKGNDKTALIDAVNHGFEQELLDNLKSITELQKIDYVIMNHAEPDHTGAIPVIMEATKAVLVASEKGAKAAEIMYKVPKERIKIVKDGDTIELGGKTLKFIDAPWLHWPETIFTYLVEDKILFSCDFFGSHTAFGTFDEDSKELITNAKKYYAEIMMPFSAMGKKALDKLKAYDIKMIAPSHGPIYKNPKTIIDAYTKWTSGETKKKATIVYASMWGSTEKMANIIAETLAAEGIETAQYDLAAADIGDVAKDLVDSRAIVFGSPTFLGAMHPIALHAVNLVKALKPPVKYAAFLNSYGWGTATKSVIDILSTTKIEFIGAVETKWVMNEEAKEKVQELGKRLAQKLNE